MEIFKIIQLTYEIFLTFCFNNFAKGSPFPNRCRNHIPFSKSTEKNVPLSPPPLLPKLQFSHGRDAFHTRAVCTSSRFTRRSVLFSTGSLKRAGAATLLSRIESSILAILESSEAHVFPRVALMLSLFYPPPAALLVPLASSLFCSFRLLPTAYSVSFSDIVSSLSPATNGNFVVIIRTA